MSRLIEDNESQLAKIHIARVGGISALSTLTIGIAETLITIFLGSTSA